MTEVLVHEDSETLAADVVSRLLDRLEEAQSRGEVPHLGLTGGTIADAVHRELARRAVDSSVDWARVVFWWGDERFVASGSPDRNAGQAADALLDHLPVDPAHVHPVGSRDEFATAEEAAAAYGDDLRTHGSGAF